MVLGEISPIWQLHYLLWLHILRSFTSWWEQSMRFHLAKFQYKKMPLYLTTMLNRRQNEPAPRIHSVMHLLHDQDEGWYVSGRQLPFWALSTPSWSLEKAKRISQCRDLRKFSTSVTALGSSRTINLPPGLTILSTSAITGTSLHLSN